MLTSAAVAGIASGALLRTPILFPLIGRGAICGLVASGFAGNGLPLVGEIAIRRAGLTFLGGSLGGRREDDQVPAVPAT